VADFRKNDIYGVGGGGSWLIIMAFYIYQINSYETLNSTNF